MCIRPTNSRPDAFCTAAGAADAVFRNGSASPSCGCLAGRARTTFGRRYVAECPGDKLVGAGVRSKECVAADGIPARRCGAGIHALGRNQHLDSDAAGSGRGRSTPDGRCRLAVRRFYRPNSGKLPPVRERSRTFPAEDRRRIRRSSRSRAFPTMQRGAPVRRAVVGGYGCPGRERGALPPTGRNASDLRTSQPRYSPGTGTEDDAEQESETSDSFLYPFPSGVSVAGRAYRNGGKFARFLNRCRTGRHRTSGEEYFGKRQNSRYAIRRLVQHTGCFIDIRVALYSERESNPHDHCWSQDFKSGVSTYSTIRASFS